MASSNTIYLQSNLFQMTKKVYVAFMEHLAIKFIVCFSVEISHHHFSIKNHIVSYKETQLLHVFENINLFTEPVILVIHKKWT